MKNNRSMKRRGFTLVELLIVIVVIGVLSAMMMLSSTEAVTSAKASNIVSNLRNLKTAALAMYVDNLDALEKVQDLADTATNSDSVTWRNVLIKYLNAGGSNNTVDENYHFVITGGNWFVYLDPIGDSRVREKLIGRADSVGLLGGNDHLQKLSTTDTAVYMLVQKMDTLIGTGTGTGTGTGN